MQVNHERKYLLGMFLSLTALIALNAMDGFFVEWPALKIVLSLAFLIIAYISAYVAKPWYGKIPLFFHILLKAIIPLVAGLLIGLTDRPRGRLVSAVLVGAIPIVCCVFALISHAQGHTTKGWQPNGIWLLNSLLSGVFWFFSTCYIHRLTWSVRNQTG